jgi:hypothetical protein
MSKSEEAAAMASALIELKSELQAVANKYEDHKTASALVALYRVRDFLDAIRVDGHLMAPLEEALNILERAADVESLRTVTSDLGLRLREKNFSRAIQHKIVGVVAVDFQLRCGVRLKDAIKKVVGDGDAKKLEDFRENMKRGTPAGTLEVYRELRGVYDELSPEDAARLSLELYIEMRGKKP